MALDWQGKWSTEMNHPIMSVPRLGGGQASPPTVPTVTPCLQTDKQDGREPVNINYPLGHLQPDEQLDLEKIYLLANILGTLGPPSGVPELLLAPFEDSRGS